MAQEKISALPTVDMLSVLPSELRLQIYSYLFSTEDEGLIVLRTTRRGDWAGDMGLPAYAILLQDPQYDSSRNRRCIRDKWPDPIEEAFHKALQWTGPYQRRLNGTHSEHTNEMITRVIYKYTGQVRNRKQISSHIQNLRRIGSRMPEAPERLKQQISRATAELQHVDTEDTAKTNRILGQIQNASFVLARRCDEIQYAAFALSQRRRRQSRQKTRAPRKPRIGPENVLPDGPAHSLFQEILHFAPQNDHELSFQPLRPLGNNFLALGSVNQFFRAEVLQYIESRSCFDFAGDAAAMQSFCRNVKPAHRQQVRHIAIEFVDSQAADFLTSSTTFGTYLSANLPNLKTVHLTLIPRDPTRDNVLDYHWGQHTEYFLSNLGDLRATVVMNLRWKKDCDYFEDRYVGVRGWKCIRRSEDPGEDDQDPYSWRLPQKKTCPGFYELTANSKKGAV